MAMAGGMMSTPTDSQARLAGIRQRLRGGGAAGGAAGPNNPAKPANQPQGQQGGGGLGFSAAGGGRPLGPPPPTPWNPPGAGSQPWEDPGFPQNPTSIRPERPGIDPGVDFQQGPGAFLPDKALATDAGPGGGGSGMSGLYGAILDQLQNQAGARNGRFPNPRMDGGGPMPYGDDARPMMIPGGQPSVDLPPVPTLSFPGTGGGLDQMDHGQSPAPYDWMSSYLGGGGVMSPGAQEPFGGGGMPFGNDAMPQSKPPVLPAPTPRPTGPNTRHPTNPGRRPAPKPRQPIGKPRQPADGGSASSFK